MTLGATEWLVILGGVAAIVWVNWYFFVAAPAPAQAAHTSGKGDGPPQVLITVRGGYSPREVRVPAGAPVRLVFDRQESSGCSEEIVFPDFGLRRFLPPNARTTIEVTPPAPGRYEFTCGMSMLRGVLVAEG